MKHISAVCFDAFGTLIKYGGHPINPYRHLTQGEHNLAAERRQFLTRNTGLADFASELGLSQMLPIIQAELNEELAGLQLFPEVQQTLDKLRRHGKRMAVCSNLAAAYGPVVRQLLPLLDAHILSFEVGAAKPEPAIYSQVCDQLSCQPSEVLFIGDSKRCDLEGPIAFGMEARWLDRRSGDTLLGALAGYL